MSKFRGKINRLVFWNVVFLIIFLILSLMPVYWYRTDSIIHGLDIGLPINYDSYIRKGLSLWDGSIDLGKKEVLRATRLVEFIVLKTIASFGFDSSINQIIYFCLVIFSILVSFYVFILTFLKENKSPLVGFFGAIFYLFNFYSLTRWEGVDRPVFYVMIGVPLVFTALMKNSSKESLGNYSLLAFSSLILGTAAINPPTFLAGVLGVIIFEVCLLVNQILEYQAGMVKKYLLIQIKSAFVALISNLFWIVPSLNLGSPRRMLELAAPVDWLDSISQFTSFESVFRLMGAWYWYDKYQGNPYAPYSMIYFQNKFYIFLTYFVPFLCLLGILICIKRKRGLSLFLVLIVGFVFSMGTHAPFKEFYSFFYNHFTLFKIFRSPWFKFTFLVILGNAFFYGIFSEYLLTRPIFKNSRVAKFGIFGGLFLLPIVLNQPLLLGHIYDNYRVNVPGYVKEGVEYLEANVIEGERLMLLPPIKNENYRWNYRSGTSAFYYLTDIGTFGSWAFTSQQNLSGEYLSRLSKMFFLKKENISPILSVLGVKYLVHRKDLVFAPDEKFESINSVQDSIYNQKELSFVVNYGGWDIYENPKIQPLFSFQPFLVKVDDQDQMFEAINNDSRVSYFLGDSSRPGALEKIRLGPKDFPEKYKQILNYHWQTKPGIEYQLALSSNFKTGVYLDGQKVKLKEGPLDFFSFVLKSTKEDYLLGVDALGRETENLLKNGDFSLETFNWEAKPEGTFFGKPRQIFRIVAPGKALLGAINQSLVLQQEAEGLEAGRRYRLRFGFQSLDGLPLQVEVKSLGVAPKIILSREENVFYAENFTIKELFISPTDSNPILLSFYLNVASAQKNSQIVGNLSISEVNEFDFLEISPIIKELPEEINYQKVGNSGYRLAFKTDRPGWLVFNSSFDKAWVARESGKTLDHILVNNLANGFYLNEAGDHLVEIIFLPQSLFEKMIKISFSFCGLLLLATFLKGLKEKIFRQSFKK